MPALIALAWSMSYRAGLHAGARMINLNRRRRKALKARMRDPDHNAMTHSQLLAGNALS
jgi:hypothetical protein